jgi:autotransporter-associated beta strand protein
MKSSGGMKSSDGATDVDSFDSQHSISDEQEQIFQACLIEAAGGGFDAPRANRRTRDTNGAFATPRAVGDPIADWRSGYFQSQGFDSNGLALHRLRPHHDRLRNVQCLIAEPDREMLALKREAGCGRLIRWRIQELVKRVGKFVAQADQAEQSDLLGIRFQLEDDVALDRLGQIGNGILTLRGENTYLGGTTIEGGKLVVANQSGSGTGSGAVSVTRGKLGGSGIIAGATTIGTGSGTGAFLAPAAATGTSQQAILTIQSAVTFNADATYSCTFKAEQHGDTTRTKTSMVIANGVTINSGAMIELIGHITGALSQGFVLTLISNTSANPMSGTFSNLPDDSIVTINGNNLQVSYSGGDGNDLTLTVVP